MERGKEKIGEERKKKGREMGNTTERENERER